MALFVMISFNAEDDAKILFGGSASCKSYNPKNQGSDILPPLHTHPRKQILVGATEEAVGVGAADAVAVEAVVFGVAERGYVVAFVEGFAEGLDFTAVFLAGFE